MEQRPLRLGDIVDDYCPRERRITNHAIVAIVEEAIRQTRCTTCDAEHIYKEGREPRRRRKEPTPVLAAASAEPANRPARYAPMTEDEKNHTSTSTAPSLEAAPPAADSETTDDTLSASGAADDAWPAHRQLIRATLPRIEGEPPVPRPIPEFTMHQRQGRGPGFRHAQGWNGNSPDRGNGFRPNRPVHGEGREGNTQGPPQGNGRPAGSRRRRGRHKPPPR